MPANKDFHIQRGEVVYILWEKAQFNIFYFVHTDFRLWYKIAKLSASVTLWARITAQLCPLLYIIHPNLNL